MPMSKMRSSYLQSTLTTAQSLAVPQNNFKAQIGKKFKLTNLGPISWLLGFAITCNHAACTITLSQHAYIETILCRFNFDNCKPLTMPMDLNMQLSKDQSPTSVEAIVEMSAVPYRESVCSLNWAAVGTQLDITFVIGCYIPEF